MNELEKQEAPRGFYTSHSFSFKYAASDLSAFVAAAGAPLFLSDAGKLEEGGGLTVLWNTIFTAIRARKSRVLFEQQLSFLVYSL